MQVIIQKIGRCSVRCMSSAIPPTGTRSPSWSGGTKRCAVGYNTWFDSTILTSFMQSCMNRFDRNIKKNLQDRVGTC